MAKLTAVIAGSGFYQFPGLENIRYEEVETPYGTPSAEFLIGEIAGHKVVFLARHGNPHVIPPHAVNYCANIWALRQLGVEQILAVNAVGGISDTMNNGVLCIPDQIIDYTSGRQHSFSYELGDELQHIDFTEPFSANLRHVLINAAKRLGLSCEATGVYGVTQGPRLETAAEIKRLEQDGCDIVGMTAMPEAALARELDIDYASVSLIVNKAAGKSDEPITMEQITAVMAAGMDEVAQLLSLSISRL